jgi:hypothetical protein
MVRVIQPYHEGDLIMSDDARRSLARILSFGLLVPIFLLLLTVALPMVQGYINWRSNYFYRDSTYIRSVFTTFNILLSAIGWPGMPIGVSSDFDLWILLGIGIILILSMWVLSWGLAHYADTH